jgi:hypothetical protein
VQQTQQPDGVQGTDEPVSAAGAGDNGVALMAACREYLRVRQQQDGLGLSKVKEEPHHTAAAAGDVMSEDDEDGQEGVMAAVELRGLPHGGVSPDMGEKKIRAEVGQGPQRCSSDVNELGGAGHLLGRAVPAAMAGSHQHVPKGASEAPVAAATALRMSLLDAVGANAAAAGLHGVGGLFDQTLPFQQVVALLQHAAAVTAVVPAPVGNGGGGVGPQGPATPTTPFAGLPPLPL